MKLLLMIGLAGGLTWFAYTQSPSRGPKGPDGPTASTPEPIKRTTTQWAGPVGRLRELGGQGHFNVVTITQLGTGEPRKFTLHVMRVKETGAVCSGTFEENGKRLQAGTIFVRGLPAGTVDGIRTTLWLEREGAQTYRRNFDDTANVASYQVIPEPTATPAKGFSGFGSTALDAPPRR